MALSTDIYNITKTIDDLKQRYIDGESEETLSLGTYGYLGATQSYLLRTALITIGELANETFASRCKFDKNIIMHAVMQNITDINATPSKVNVILGFLESDISQLMISNRVVIDKNCKFFIEDYEFHLDYDIIISQTKIVNNTTIYTARYDISIKNNLSDIINPYLSAPAMVNVEGRMYLFINCHFRQVSHIEKNSRLISSNIIDNKTFDFTFEDQLADFNVIVKEGNNTKTLTPIFEGVNMNNLMSFCYYTYIDTNSIRVKFDKTSYMPGLNAEISVKIKTTKGIKGNFSYNKDLLVVLESDNINYRNATALLRLQSDAIGGQDRRSMEELKRILPKEALSRGTISTTQDLDNYFNMINTDINRMVVSEKVDNQFERSFYAYMILKDGSNNIVPTNTININIPLTEFTIIENGIHVLSQGSYILYDSVTKIGTVVKNPTTEQLEASKFLYTTPFMTVINFSPLYVAYYMPLVSESYLLYFKYINQEAPLQFISTNVWWKREFLTDKDTYKLDIKLSQNVEQDFGMIVEVKDEDGKITDVECNIRVICIIYNKGKIIYRYAEAKLIAYDLEAFSYQFRFEFTTDDVIDIDNKIKINNVNNILSGEETYGFFTSKVDMDIYALPKFKDIEYGRHDLDALVPNLTGYSVSNVYNIYEGLDFYTNFSSNISSVVTLNSIPNNKGIIDDFDGYNVNGIPVVKYSYTRDESHMQLISSQLNYKKLYIDFAILKLENNFTIDFKLFNTYGPSQTYSISDDSMLDKVNVELFFRMKILSNVDKNVKEYIVRDIKNIIENISKLGSVHFPNIISTIKNKYDSSIEYIEFLGMNDYGPGMQHLYFNDVDDISIVPEFVTVDVDDVTLEPKIHIELK